MIRPSKKSDSLSMDEKISAACVDTGEQVVERAERTGTEVVIWREGRIVRLSAAEARAELNQKQNRPATHG